MNNNSWFKKEMPLQTVIGFGGGATGFGAHSSALSKLYVDDVFGNYLYKGTATARSITNAVDMSKGGMLWIKSRSHGFAPALVDSERGVSKFLRSDTNAAEVTDSNGVTAFNNNGFSLGIDNVNGYFNYGDNEVDYASWSFRKAKGFCDIVTWTGNGSARTITHNLGSVPGMIMVKRTDGADNWVVYHRGNADANNAGNYFLRLNTTAAKQDSSSRFNDTEPTASVFSVGTDAGVNASGGT